MKLDTISMIDALHTGDAAAAQEAFNRAMLHKVNAAVDERKVEVAGQIYNSSVKTESYSPLEEATAPTHQHDAAVHHDATNTIDHVHSIMKSKGYTRKAFTASANRDHEYTKAGHPSVTLSTWHGTGNYGAGTAVHSLYVNSKEVHGDSNAPGSTIADKHYTNSHFTSAGVENHKKLGQKIVSHVKSL